MPFDPYYKWLGIPPADQPPNHYRLLGITLFESDPDVIDAAAEQRMTFLRTCAGGAHVAESQKLLNEVAAARLCLLGSETRSLYEAGLKPRPPAGNQEERIFELPAATVPAIDFASWTARKELATTASPRHDWRQDWRVQSGAVGAAVLLIAVTLVSLFDQTAPPPTRKSRAGEQAAGTTQPRKDQSLSASKNQIAGAPADGTAPPGGQSAPPQTPGSVDATRPRAVDIVFLLDTTASMEPFIQGLRKKCIDFAALVRRDGYDCQLALIGFGDVDFKEPLQVFAPTADIPLFQKHVAALQRTNGGDQPESSVEALRRALQLQFRSGAAVCFVHITDADCHHEHELAPLGKELQKRSIVTYVVSSEQHRKLYNPLYLNNDGFYAIEGADFGEILVKVARSIRSQIGHK